MTKATLDWLPKVLRERGSEERNLVDDSDVRGSAGGGVLLKSSVVVEVWSMFSSRMLLTALVEAKCDFPQPQTLLLVYQKVCDTS